MPAAPRRSDDQADFDVIVVGARVAGSVTAILLGEGGQRVLLLDRTYFPSDTLSTHFFRAPALRAFQEIGVLEQVLETAPRLVVDYNVVDGIVFPEPVQGPEDYPYYLCVRRVTLDAILAARAQRTPHVEFLELTRVQGLLREEGRVVGVTWDGPGGAKRATARAVVGADGVNSWVARQVQPTYEHREPVHRAMYYSYFRGMQWQDGPAAEFHYRGNYLVYVFPCDDSLTLLAVSLPITDFNEFRKNPEARYAQELQAMSVVAPRLPLARRAGRLLGTGSIPGYLRVPFGPGWALVGDAGMVMDPWSGQGIDQASTHAVILAHQLSRFLNAATDWESAMEAYHRARNEFSLKTYQRTCKFGQDFRPMTHKALERRGLVPAGTT